MWTLEGTAIPCKGVTTHLQKFVTHSDSSTGCRTLLRHSRDENALEDKWALVLKSTSRAKHLPLMGVSGHSTVGTTSYKHRPGLSSREDSKTSNVRSRIAGQKGCTQLLGRL